MPISAHRLTRSLFALLGLLAVLGDEPARVVGIDSPPTARLDG